MRLARLLLVPLALAAASLLASCGDEDEPVPVDGDGYSFEMPAGWEEVTGDSEEIADLIGGAGADAAAGTFDAVVVSDEVTDDFRTNFNVGSQEGLPAGYDARRVVDENITVFEDPGAQREILPEGISIDYDGTPPPRRTQLGGEEAYVVEYMIDSPEGEARVAQVFAVYDGAAYVGTFTAAPEAFESEYGDFEEILGSWEFD